MKRVIIFILPLLFLQISCFAQGNEEFPPPPNRIISMSPGITEILYELELGDKVIAVTDYCNYPEEVNNKFTIGGYRNINYEAIVFLKPDLVIAQTEYSEDIKSLFDSTGIEYMTVNTQTVDGIFKSIKEIGRRNGIEDRAEKIVARMCKDIVRLRRKTAKKPRRRIMVVLDRNRGSFENLSIAGKNTFYDGLLSVLGCENAYTKSDISYPTLSLELISKLNPDIIIEMQPNCPEEEKSEIITEWKSFKNIKAVKNNKVYVFNGDYVYIFGPRFMLILKDIADVL